ncbi:MAG TPA: hypothetical protein VGN72_19690 [Tepidisphaeraceae bacterium]|jgi:hypothetical protein|nr:hypothetical protein [Tepidisphaeraceae bacterium]
MAKPFPCPKCNRPLRASGEITDESGNTYPTYQCDECIKVTNVFGKQMELHLTFMVKDGKAYDPAEPDGELRI